MAKARKKVKEANSLDVTFQSGMGSQANTTTKTVQAGNPGDALRQAMQGENPKGQITINPTQQGGAPGAPAAAPVPGKPIQQMAAKPNLPMESAKFPFRMMLPSSYRTVMERLTDNINGVKMTVVNGRYGIVIESLTDMNAVVNELDLMGTPSSKLLVENLGKAFR